MSITTRNNAARQCMNNVASLTCVSAASLARKVYMRQNIGIGTFARQYGGRNKRKGTVPEHFARASRGLIRHMLKQVRTRTCWRSMLTVSRCLEGDMRMFCIRHLECYQPGSTDMARACCNALTASA